MEFCDECGGIIVPEKEKGETHFKCRSCGKKYRKEEGEMVIREEKNKNREDLVLEDQEEESLPVTDEKCPECGNDKAYWWMEQTRAADEPKTRFFKCTECDHAWREYD